MDPAGELAELLQPEGELLARAVQELVGSAGVVRELRLRHSERERERDEPLLRAVVEVALEPAPLCVARLDDAGARRGQLLARLRVRQRNRDEPGELPETLLGVGAEPVGRPDRDGGRAPEAPGHDDRRRDL